MNRLEVHDLRTSFATEEGRVDAVADVRFAIRAGQTMAIVGESGSGKSVTSLTLMRLLPRPRRRRSSGEAWFVDRPANGSTCSRCPSRACARCAATSSR